jgi:anti-sigma factor RsiW
MSTRELVCKELVELVTDYLEGSLAPETRARFEAHLADCDGCTHYLAQMQQSIRITGRLSEDDLTPEAKDTLLHLFRDWKREQEGN